MSERELDDLMSRLAGGDRDAFDPLFRALWPRALAAAGRRLESQAGVLSVAGVVSLQSVAWLLPILLVWSFLGWRGALVWRGALSGLGAGLVALALPMSLLRPCCASMMTATDCSMPQVCVAAGAVLGLGVVLSLPRLRTTAEWARASGGALAAVASIVATRCVSLFVGEVLGLAGGLLVSAVAVSVARAWWAGRVARLDA